ncbi:MAG: hypothetical protein JSS00_10880 [Proteobacteria bacterium]|nr:hypothetical protein [Pseudomonadota bacterium]
MQEMSLIIQMIANIAVIASLVFVAFQVRMGMQMLRDNAVRNHTDKVQSVSRMLSENPQLCELWARGSKAGLDGLSDAERVQFVNFYTHVLRVWEELYLQYKTGLMDNALWAANMTILRDTHRMRGAQEAWAVRRHLFTAPFQDFYDAYASEGQAKPLYELPRESPT